MRRFVLIVTHPGKVYIYLSIPIQGFGNFSRNMLSSEFFYFKFLLQLYSSLLFSFSEQ